MATAKDEIKGALRLLGIIAEGEEASASTMIDALESLNIMIDGMALERLLIHATQIQSFSWPAATATRTIGPSGDFIGLRPAELDDKSFYTLSGVDYHISKIGEEQYNSISAKGSTGHPYFMFVNMTVPNVTISLYPVPSSETSFSFSSIVELTQPADLTTVLVLPPGYKRMFRYNLAVEISAMYGMDPPTSVIMIARDSKRSVKRQNTSNMDMRMSLPIMTRARSDIFAG